MLDELLNQYADRFGENFPIFHFMGASENEIIEHIRHALETGQPYEAPDDDPEILY